MGEKGTDLFKMHRKYAQQAHREGRRGATLFESSSVATAPHAGRYVPEGKNMNKNIEVENDN
jgi:hypothetical protein